MHLVALNQYCNVFEFIEHHTSRVYIHKFLSSYVLLLAAFTSAINFMNNSKNKYHD